MMDDAIRDYIDTRIKNVEDKLDSQKEFNAMHFDLNENAIRKAEDSMTNRLEGMNEFRDQLREERGLLASKEYVQSRVESLARDIKKLEMTGSFSSGKMWMVMALFAAIPTIIALIAFVRSI